MLHFNQVLALITMSTAPAYLFVSYRMARRLASGYRDGGTRVIVSLFLGYGY